MEKLLTIVIPTYNMENYLRQCLDSLLLPSWMEQLEVLVINDGSRDQSSVIAKEYQSKFPNTFKVIDKENGNYGSCINRGLQEATGKYIKILDADDRFEKEGFSLLLKTLQENDADLFLTDTQQVYENGTYASLDKIDITNQKVLAIQNTDIRKYIPMHCITYNLHIFKNMNYHQTEGISYTDTEWALLPFTAVQTCYYLPITVYRYLIGREGQTMDPAIWQKQSSQFLIVLKNIVTFMEKSKLFTLDVYTVRALKARLRRFYLDCLLNNYEQQKSVLFDLDNFIQMTSPELYQQMNQFVYGKREKIPFVSIWRKKQRVSLRLKLAYKIHKFLGKQK